MLPTSCAGAVQLTSNVNPAPGRVFGAIACWANSRTPLQGAAEPVDVPLSQRTVTSAESTGVNVPASCVVWFSGRADIWQPHLTAGGSAVVSWINCVWPGVHPVMLTLPRHDQVQGYW